MRDALPMDCATHQSSFYKSCRTIVRVIARIYFRWRIHNAEGIPSTGPVIIASNHVSFLDPPLIGSAVERTVHFLARKSLFKIPLVGRCIRLLNSVPVDRDGGGGAGLKAILDRLDAGCAVVLFPEGTRSPDGRPARARAGVGLTVVKSGALVVPVRIVGAFEACGRGHRVPRPHPIDIVFGATLDFAVLRAEAENCDKARLKVIYQEVADAIMNAIASLEPPTR